MSTVQKRLASYILREHFGDIVEAVGSYLVQKGARSLKDIIFDTKLKKEQVCFKFGIFLKINNIS